MNDLATQPIDIEQERAWLAAHKVESGLSWPALGSKIDINHTTLGLFAAENYAGDNRKIALAVRKYRQWIDEQQMLGIDAPEIPDYFETETSKRLMNLAALCQRKPGRMAYAALGSGLGKTITLRRYQEQFPNVIIVTMRPSAAGLPPMLAAVLRALGEDNVKGAQDDLSRRVTDRLSNRHNCLLVFDEAQELSVKAIEEIRYWNGEAGTGILFLGDLRLAQLIQNGFGKGDLPQLRRRCMPYVQAVPFETDIEALADAWQIEGTSLRTELTRIAMLPGGLGQATQTLELATMIASAQARGVSLADIRAAWGQLCPARIVK